LISPRILLKDYDLEKFLDPRAGLNNVKIRARYRCPNIRYEGYGVYTNTPPSGAMRGFTSTPIHFAMESEMDEIAYAIGMDPAEFRLKNALEVGDIILVNEKPVTSSGLREAISKGKTAIGWERRQEVPWR